VKILFYNHTGQMGGAERVLLTILSELNRGMFQPVAICPREGSLQGMIAELNVPVETAPVLHARFTWRPDHALLYLRSFAQVILQLRKQIIRLDPDLIHANSIRAGLVMTAATIGLGKRVIWHVHDLLPRHPFNPLIRLAARASRHTQIIAVAQASADRFIGPFRGLRKRTTVILNGIDVAKFHHDPLARQRIRNDLRLKDEGFVIGIVGRLSPTKGQLELLRALPDVIGKVPNTTLAIVGSPAFNREDEYAQHIERTIGELGLSDHVRMLGERDDIATIMQAFDVLVVNSTTEACPLVVLEGMASGTAVVATRVGGTPEIITHKEDGWLIASGDRAGLAQALVTLLQDEGLRARLGRNARERVSTQFSSTRFLRDILAFYSRLNHQGSPKLASKLFDEKLATD
jgi:glycosyltransferase involved in cell wall biosynthesis